MTAASIGPLNIAKMYIGLEGATDFQFSAAPTAVTFDGGSASTTIAQNTSKVSDAVSFSYDGTADLVVSVYTSGSAAYRVNSTNASGAAKYKGGDDAITQAASGYSTQAGVQEFLALIEGS
jgi:hypothetical protein